MHAEVVFVLLFSVATAVALLVRRIKAPYTVALVVTGVLLGISKTIPAPHLTKELLYALFLPGLLFEAAFHLEFRRFWQNKLAISSLAVPGLVVAIALTAVILRSVASALGFVDHFSLGEALVFAALIAATDPIAVTALFKTLGAPKRLAVLVEGESLLNDGTAVVVFTLVSAAALGGGGIQLVPAVVEFVRVVGIGAVVGGVISFAAAKITQQVDDPMIEITLTTIAAWGSFAVAEQMHASGVIATVVAGMVCGNYAATTGMSPSTRLAVASFWEYVAFALNSLVFLLIGFEVKLDLLAAAWRPILVAYVAVMAARAVMLYTTTALLQRTSERVPWSWTAVLTWGGLRGALSMVLALALPASFEHKDLMIAMTFGVVLISILLQGLTMGTLLKRVGIVGHGKTRIEYEKDRGTLRAARAALAQVNRWEHEGGVHVDTLRALRDEYEQTIADTEERMRTLHLEEGALRDEEMATVRRHLLAVQKDAVHDAIRAGVVAPEAGEEVLRDLDHRIEELEDA